MRGISSEIEIEAPAEAVWAVLADLPRYAEWNPFIVKAAGELETGKRLEVTLRPPGHKATTFRPTITALEPGRLLRWLGHTGMSGVFDGEHTHQLVPTGPGSCRYVQSERFGGVMVPFLGKMIADAQTGFRDMNVALKTRAEAAAAVGVARSA